VLTALFFIVPFVKAIFLAFYETNGPRSRAFVGLDNFRFLLHDTNFHAALFNTTLFAVVSVCVQLPLAMGLALLLNGSGSRVRAVFRLIFFSPNFIGQVLVGILFFALFTPRYGLLPRAFHELLFTDLDAHWLTDPPLIRLTIVIASLWLWVGFNMVYFLAALQTVDKFVVIMSVIGSYQLFELPLTLLSESNGYGAKNAGLTLITYLNYNGFRTGDLGLGSAVGWVVALIIFTISLIQIRLARLTEE
jgi:ABC-type sugar transport system permease subunit